MLYLLGEILHYYTILPLLLPCIKIGLALCICSCCKLLLLWSACYQFGKRAHSAQSSCYVDKLYLASCGWFEVGRETLMQNSWRGCLFTLTPDPVGGPWPQPCTSAEQSCPNHENILVGEPRDLHKSSSARESTFKFT